MYPMRKSIIVWHTSGTISDISCFEILNKYCKLVKESPVARNRKVTANLSSGGTAKRKVVSLFRILSFTLFNRKLKSSWDILTKFTNFPLSLSVNISVNKNVLLTLFNRLLFKYNCDDHQRLRTFLFFFNKVCKITKLVQATAMS